MGEYKCVLRQALCSLLEAKISLKPLSVGLVELGAKLRCGNCLQRNTANSCLRHEASHFPCTVLTAASMHVLQG